MYVEKRRRLPLRAILASRTMPKGKDSPQTQNVSDKASSAFDAEQDEAAQKFAVRRPHWRADELGAG
jgi:hypothetical protein